MRMGMSWIAAVAVLILGGAVMAEAVHQSLAGDKIYTSDGGSAVDKGQMEAKKVSGAESADGQVARVKGTMGQWGFVTCWFGLPAPEGKAVVRLRLYVDDQKTAHYSLYTVNKKGQSGIGALKIPADAKAGSFVTVDVPVDAKAEWSGLAIKKTEKSNLPGPWIDTVSVVLPD